MSPSELRLATACATGENAAASHARYWHCGDIETPKKGARGLTLLVPGWKVRGIGNGTGKPGYARARLGIAGSPRKQPNFDIFGGMTSNTASAAYATIRAIAQS